GEVAGLKAGASMAGHSGRSCSTCDIRLERHRRPFTLTILPFWDDRNAAPLWNSSPPHLHASATQRGPGDRPGSLGRLYDRVGDGQAESCSTRRIGCSMEPIKDDQAFVI